MSIFIYFLIQHSFPDIISYIADIVLVFPLTHLIFDSNRWVAFQKPDMPKYISKFTTDNRNNLETIKAKSACVHYDMDL